MRVPPASTAEQTAERAAETVRVLAREPRPAGGDAEARARAHCAERLRNAGFTVREAPFEYSAFPGRWGTPIAGLVGGGLLLAAAGAAHGGRPGVALAVLSLGGAALGGVARAMARDGVLTFPAQRRRGVNLVATRGNEPPRHWLMAHVDSKSQPVPILVRAGGVTLLLVTALLAVVVAGLQLAGVVLAEESPIWTSLAVATVVGAIPVVATTVGALSPGALDNATGVATVLAAAEASGEAPIGVCLTSAEELGLAGARAWVRGQPRVPGVVAINCDGVDDHGATTCMYSGRRPGALVEAVIAAASKVGTTLRAHRLLPGVLTDGVAIADAGWPVVTLSKGSARTLARIHTRHDRPDRITGIGIAEVARVMVAVIQTKT